MNQKISTGLGIAIILVMAYTAGYFVWMNQRNSIEAVSTPQSILLETTSILPVVPSEVDKKIQECVYAAGWYGSSGNGLTVDWGDGKIEPQYSYTEEKNRGKSCTLVVRSHTYSAPGTYIISLSSWHPGPTDRSVVDWQDTETVVVSDSNSKVEIAREYFPDEGVFTFKLNTETVERFSGVNSWTRRHEDYYYVHYQEPSGFSEKGFYTDKSGVRLDEIANFEYDPKHEYTIKIERRRSHTYHAEDVGWYTYRLISGVVDK